MRKILVVAIIAMICILGYLLFKNNQEYQTYVEKIEKYELDYNVDKKLITTSYLNKVEEDIEKYEELYIDDLVNQILKLDENFPVKTDYDSFDQTIYYLEYQLKIAENFDSCKPFFVEDILLVNKTFCIPSDYASSVSKEAMNAYQEMYQDAKEEGIHLVILSDYRSHEEQIYTYTYWVSVSGEEAKNYSAEPGHSEHETGLAIDVGSDSGECDLSSCFAYTKEGEWLELNAHNYGFIIRYPEGKEDITGYSYEPWHLRYVGVDHANYMYYNDLCLEEYILELITKNAPE